MHPKSFKRQFFDRLKEIRFFRGGHDLWLEQKPLGCIVEWKEFVLIVGAPGHTNWIPRDPGEDASRRSKAGNETGTTRAVSNIGRSVKNFIMPKRSSKKIDMPLSDSVGSPRSPFSQASRTPPKTLS